MQGRLQALQIISRLRALRQEQQAQASTAQLPPAPPAELPELLPLAAGDEWEHQRMTGPELLSMLATVALHPQH